MIALAADIYSLSCLRAASQALHRLKIDDIFWKKRLSNDMPWVHHVGIPDYTLEADTSEAVDWGRVYHNLLRKNQPKMKGRPRIWPGLVNRSRIWARCEELLKYYLERQEMMQQEPPLTSEVCEDATCTRMPHLIHPDPKDSKPFTLPLYDSFEGVLKSQPILQTFWTHNAGELRSIKLLKSDCTCPCNRILALSGSLIRLSGQLNRQSNGEELVVFPRASWLAAIVVTSEEDPILHSHGDSFRKVIGLCFVFTNGERPQAGQSEGDRRALQVPEGHFAVGFRGEIVYGDRITRLAVLTQPVSKLSSILSSRRPPSIKTPTSVEIWQKYLWKDSVPCPSLEIEQLEFRFDNSTDPPFYLSADLAAMQHLIFGTTEEELADITGFSVDETFGGFQVHYAHRATRSIGSYMHALKTLSSKPNLTEQQALVLPCISEGFNPSLVPSVLKTVC